MLWLSWYNASSKGSYQRTSTEQAEDKHRTSTEQVPSKFANSFHTENVGIVRLLAAIGTQEMSVKQIMEAIGLKHRPTFLENYLNPSIANGYIRLLFPESPRHPRQKYLLTVKGGSCVQRTQIGREERNDEEALAPLLRA